LDPITLLDKIEAAQKAIGDRLEDALHGRSPINGNERELIEDARRNFYFLKKHPRHDTRRQTHGTQGRGSASATSGGRVDFNRARDSNLHGLR
jgi:hypothetical protein